MFRALWVMTTPRWELKVEVICQGNLTTCGLARISMDGKAVGTTSILDRGQFIFLFFFKD